MSLLLGLTPAFFSATVKPMWKDARDGIFLVFVELHSSQGKFSVLDLS
jgi:hypothetical protein